MATADCMMIPFLPCLICVPVGTFQERRNSGPTQRAPRLGAPQVVFFVSSSRTGAPTATSGGTRTCPFGLCRRRGRSYFDSLRQARFAERRGDLQHAVVVLRRELRGVHAFGQHDGSLHAAIGELLLQIICV